MSVEAWHAGVWAGPLGGHDGGEKMASAMRKMAVYLGLVEDDHRYDEYQDEYGTEDDYDEYGTDLVAQEDRSAAYSGFVDQDEHVPVQIQTTDLTRITTLHPRTYNEARTIGEHFRDGTPVIMNLTELVDSDARRLIDFAAGLIFGLRGSIDKVTNKVFLLSPANIEVAAEDKARIAERGFFNQS
jgi:cell division inhibitor SepF